MPDVFYLVGEKFADRITLKSVEINKGASQETTCFSATVYVDGKRVARVRNHGMGGSNYYDPPPVGASARKAAYKAWDEFEKECKAYAELYEPGCAGNSEACDWAIDAALARWQYAKKCKGKVIFQYFGDGDSWYEVKHPATAKLWLTSPDDARMFFFQKAPGRGYIDDRGTRPVGFLNDLAQGRDAWYEPSGPNGEWRPIQPKPPLGPKPDIGEQADIL